MNLDKKLVIGLGLFTTGGLFYIHTLYSQMNELKTSLLEAVHQKEVIKLQTMLNAEKEQKEYLQKELDRCKNPNKVVLPPLKLPPLK
jgi:hypothetical protein